MKYAVIGFIDVLLGLGVGTFTARRRGTGMAVLWGVISFLLGLLGVVAWAIYMGVSGRNRPAAGSPSP
ncbi:MAG: hypothetical protein ABR541_04265 [Candidatus Dormibacteria bacterium]